MISAVLRDKVLDLIEKRITVEELEEWLVPQLPIMISDPNSADSDLVSAIELGMTELNNGMRSDDNFIDFIREALLEKTATLVISDTISSSSNRTQHTVQNNVNDLISVVWSQS